ncbi:SH2 domain-containing protein 4B-like [Anneissia japonica]|uniref:SH2 domain-containing protein 4B-like n=1 Tax=Anneissia japonica TaxID=1529436 RepID=UPI001425B2DB|nr:SH2 domain-containing protein 4B-like [Anneissia japonica]XP_033113905.1 SH2 domain-containing protein 4B-like [Anneissia japonica]
MLQQILKDMYIDPELLAELSEEQKQILYFKMREEQVRRWKEWNAKVEKQKNIKKKNGKKIDFLLAKDGNPWVWVMGEHKNDKTIEEILQEESFETARKEAHKEAELKRLKEIAERKKIEEEERRKQKELKEERERIAREKAALEEKARKIKEQEERRRKEEEKIKREEEKLLKAKEERARQEREKAVMEEQKRKEARVKQEKEKQEKQKREKEQQDMLKKLEEEKLQKEKRAKEIIEKEKQLQLQMEREEKEIKDREVDREAKQKTEEEKRAEEIYKTLQKKRKQSIHEAEKNRERIEHIWNVQLRKSRTADQDRRSWAQWARDEVRKSRQSRDFDSLQITDIVDNTKGRGPKPKNRHEVIEWYKEVELPKKAGFDLITNRPDTWMHGILSRNETEVILEDKEPGTFLVRLSERIWGYTLSFKDKERIKHFLIDASLSGYQFFGTDQVIHKKLKDLVEFHKMQPISQLGKEVLKEPQGQTSNTPDYDILLS